MIDVKNRVFAWLLVCIYGMSCNCYALSFSDFFVSFLSNPSGQSANAAYPMKNAGAVVRSSTDFKPVLCSKKNGLAVVCSDSLSKISDESRYPKVAVVNTSAKTSTVCTFDKQAGRWRVIEMSNIKTDEFQDKSFIVFLSEYSRNSEFQMKHTIFPFPVRLFSNKKTVEPETILRMPREWNSLDFSQKFSSVSFFLTKNFEKDNNRRFAIYKDGKLFDIYNFIKINGRWYLIEKEEYR